MGEAEVARRMDRAGKWLEEDGLTLIEGWARDDLTHEEIAARMGVGRSTLYDWRMKYPQIAEALRRGRELTDYLVEKALLEKALAGDLRAQMYWLNNRMAHRWSANPADRPKTGADGGVTVLVDV